jgi:glutathione S-transferase
MPSLKLVSHYLCPYVQRAAIALTEKGVPFARENIDLTNPPAWFKVISPTGKVPLLIIDDQHVLFESAAICDYLDETLTPRLHPEDSIARAQQRAWIEFASGTLNDIWLLYTARDEKTFDDKLFALATRFQRVEEVLNDGPFFGGQHFSLVDAAFAPIFRYFDVFETFLETGVFTGTPQVRAWRNALSARSSVRNAVGPDYPARLQAYVRAQRGYMSVLIAEVA